MMEERNRNIIEKMIPRYAIVPIIGMLAVNVFTYFITPVWTNQRPHYSMETALDDVIPFVPIFVIPYILAFAQWIIGYLEIAKKGVTYCNMILYGEIVAKIFVCALFILIPTTMNRGTISNNDMFSNLVAYIYKLDAPVNLFPSIHCLESWICFRGSLNRKYFSLKYIIAMGIMTIMVFLSTIFIKQHVVLDIFGAIFVAEAGLFIVRAINHRHLS